MWSRYASAITCTSMCRGCRRRRSRYSVPSAKAASASRRAAPSASSRSSARSTTRMPLPPPPAEAFTSSGNPTSGRSRAQRLDRLVVRPRSRHARHASGLHQAPRLELRPHALDHVGGRTDEGQPGIGTRRREGGAFAEEAVPGVNGVGAGPAAASMIPIHGQVRCDRAEVAGPVEADGLVGHEHVRAVGVGARRTRPPRRGRARGTRARCAPRSPLDWQSVPYACRWGPVVHPGGRFSRNARRPSWPSSLTRWRAIASAVSRRSAASGSGASRARSALVARCARSGPEREFVEALPYEGVEGAGRTDLVDQTQAPRLACRQAVGPQEQRACRGDAETPDDVRRDRGRAGCRPAPR